ncbi:MAG: hypothetical protein AB1393_13760 [Candidatus Edwardsbacteria bacterium]
MNFSNNLSVTIFVSLGLLGIVTTVFAFVLPHLCPEEEKKKKRQPFRLVLINLTCRRIKIGPLEIEPHLRISGKWLGFVSGFVSMVFATNFFTVAAELIPRFSSLIVPLSRVLLSFAGLFFLAILASFFRDFPQWIERSRGMELLHRKKLS